VLFREHIDQLRIEPEVRQTKLTFNDLKEIIPQQKVAPVQFEVLNARIVIANRTPATLKQDRSNIAAALEHIRSNGDRLIENLRNSNCDRRLLDAVRDLQSQLLENGSVVKIGMANLSCGTMFAQFQAELPNAIAAMFGSYCGSVSMYVAQFPEWEQFTQKAAAIDLDESDISEVNAAAEHLVSALIDRPDLADPDVPKTIEFVRQFLSLPGPSSKRAIFAVIRTIENLVSSILNFTYELTKKTAEKAVERGSTAASHILAGMLGLALIGALGIASTATRAGAPWVKEAIEIVQRQIENPD
jgi:hypothetical protein